MLLPAQYALSTPTISSGVLYVGADNGYAYAYNLNSVAFVFGQMSSMTNDYLTLHGMTNVPSGTLFHYLWDFGDGNTSTLSTVDHVYAKAGTYNVTLKVTDPAGRWASNTSPITVEAAPPTDSDNTWIWIALVVVIVVLLAAAFLVMRARKGKKL
jgi:chitodextrinase